MDLFNMGISMWFNRKKPRLLFKIGPVATMKNPPRSHSPLGYPSPPPCPPKEELVIMFQMTDEQQVTLTVTATDARGNPVPATTLGGTWLVDLPTVVALTPSADGSSCVCSAVGPLGTANVTFNGTLPNGGAAVTGTLGITIVASAPTSVVLTPGTPTPITPAP